MTVFEEACYLSNKQWVDSLPSEFEPYEFSKKHEKRMAVLFDKMRGDKYHRFTRKATTALIAAIIAMSVTITAFAVPATRDFLIHNFFDHSAYQLVNAEPNEVTDELIIGYIPEGFELTNETKNKTEYTVDYINDSNQWFSISKFSLNVNTDFDTENYSYKVTEYNGIKYINYYNHSINGYIWNDGKNIFEIVANLSTEEVFNIVISIK